MDRDLGIHSHLPICFFDIYARDPADSEHLARRVTPSYCARFVPFTGIDRNGLNRSAVSQDLRICEFGDLSVAYLLPAQKFSRILSRICWALTGFEIDEQIRDFLRIRFGLATQTAAATSPLLAAALCGGRKTSR
jgi:hypothetical protein